MSSIAMILKNIKNLIPYFLLIATYFIFVNLEASNDSNNIKTIEKQNKLNDINANLNNKQSRIKIPVIPYEK